MKYINVLAVVLLIASCPSRVFAQVASEVAVTDSRLSNDPPTNFNDVVKFDFKKSLTVGLPTSAYYSGVMTFAPWSDNSGNKHHQLGFNEAGLFWRTGLPTSTSWDSWPQTNSLFVLLIH
ncbi:MAG TPA: hypothetical protein VD927_05795 [Chryseosolibacter sp.]|nr:hypothetical protein [Chryseosolibacter sp.]